MCLYVCVHMCARVCFCVCMCVFHLLHSASKNSEDKNVYQFYMHYDIYMCVFICTFASIIVGDMQYLH
jgi:mannose/fructose/N-acetylgalactosamine-specific phosphotransferase system component IIC